MSSEQLTGEVVGYEDTGDLTRAMYNLTHWVLSQGRGPTMFHKIDDRQVELAAAMFKPLTERIQVVAGIQIPTTPLDYKLTLNYLLLSHYLCYGEVPTVNWKTRKKTFKKEQVTRSLGVLAKFLGQPLYEIEQRFGSHLEKQFDDGGVSYFRLETSRDGSRKVVRCRNSINLTDPELRMIPMTVMRAEVDYIVNTARSQPVRVWFLKDDGSVRQLDISLDPVLLQSVYGSDEMLRLANVEDHLHRGYIRVPELGLSRYDTRQIRSVNLNRILAITTEFEPDLRYVNIDLDSVVGEFIERSTSFSQVQCQAVAHTLVYETLAAEEILPSLGSATGLANWAQGMVNSFTTTFQKALAQFMLDHPEMFPGYDGAPRSSAQGIDSNLEYVSFPDSDDSSTLDVSDPMSFLVGF